MYFSATKETGGQRGHQEVTRAIPRLQTRGGAPGPEDAQVVQDVGHDRGPQPIVEGQVEHEQADIPRIDHAEQALVLVAVLEPDVRGHDGGSEEPPVGAAELVIEQAEACPVGERDQGGGVEPLHETERDDVEDLEGDHRAEQHQPPVHDLLEEPGVQADPRPLGEDVARLVLARYSPGSQDEAAQDGESDSPGEDEPRGVKAGGHAAVRAPDAHEADRGMDPRLEEGVRHAHDEQ